MAPEHPENDNDDATGTRRQGLLSQYWVTIENLPSGIVTEEDISTWVLEKFNVQAVRVAYATTPSTRDAKDRYLIELPTPVVDTALFDNTTRQNNGNGKGNNDVPFTIHNICLEDVRSDDFAKKLLQKRKVNKKNNNDERQENSDDTVSLSKRCLLVNESMTPTTTSSAATVTSPQSNFKLEKESLLKLLEGCLDHKVKQMIEFQRNRSPKEKSVPSIIVEFE